MIWYRVLYSSGRFDAIEGLAELERVIARRAPRVIWFAEAIIHTCQICGTSGPWGPQWIAWQRYSERWAARGEGTDLYCSEACAKAENPDSKWPHWMDVNDEPVPIEVRQARRRARDREQERKRQTTSHRKVPMPEWRGQGFCKWCNEPMRKGERATMWHRECARLYMIATGAYQARRALRERDGPTCAWPGCDQLGDEVDHRIPLWSIDRTLPLDQLRWFYLLENLWLLCQAHHKAKTRREAAQRALERKLAAAQLALPIQK